MTAAAEAKAAKSCKALAMSGGGSKGSFEAGALWGLIKNDNDTGKYAYDVVTGVSAGAINTGAISLFAPGDEVNMVTFLSDTWASINNADVYKQWSPLGILTGLFSESGIFDDSPLVAFLKSIFE
jgi:predicted acylesterase/phospholipase RssA